MWTDTHELLVVNPRMWHMGLLALDVWDVWPREEILHLCLVWVCWFDEDVES